MTLTQYKTNLNQELKQRSITFLLQGDKILLGCKKEGFGQGYWIGIGGKKEENEGIEEAAIRELQEEIFVTPVDLEKVAILDFYFPFAEKPEKWNQQVVVFLCKKWTGEIGESDEIRPEWFEKSQLPFENMWDDYKIWLERILIGEKLHMEFLYGADMKVLEWGLLGKI